MIQKTCHSETSNTNENTFVYRISTDVHFVIIIHNKNVYLHVESKNIKL